MGTSSGYGGGVGGDWTPAKRAASSFARTGGPEFASRALGRLVRALGGAAAVASASQAGRQGAQRVAALGSAAGDVGLAEGLERIGLGDLVGRPSSDIVDALIDFIGGAGEDFDAQAARDAACDLFERLEDSGSFEELEERLEGLGGVRELLELFVASYIYRRLLPVIDERLERLEDAELKTRRDREARDVVEAIVRLRLSERELDDLDWSAPEAEASIRELFRDTLTALEDLGD